MSRYRFRLLLMTVIFMSLLLRYLVPPNPLYDATHDDGLMVRLGASILRGNWLGNYGSHMLLSKPAGYPLFLAWTHFLPWAPTLTVHIVLLVGIMLVARELRYMGMSRGFVLLFGALSSLHPQWFGAQMSRIYREGLLTALTFLALGLSLWLGRIIPIWLENRKIQRRVAVEVIVVSFLTGITLSWSIATKPGWYPLAVVILGFSVRKIIFIRSLNWRVWLPRIATIVITATIGLASIVGYVVLRNYKSYEIAQLDTFSTGSFPEVLNKWASVQSDDTRKYLLVDATQRKRVYAISPTAKKLEPFLELSPGNGWRGSSCSSPLQICDESTAWFVWDLRDALHSAGLDTSAKRFELSFAQISHDITDACHLKIFTCTNSGIAPGVISLAEMSKRELVDSYATGIAWLVSPDIGITARGGLVPTGTTTKNWDQVVKGLPERTALNPYRPEVGAIGNTISLLQQLYRIVSPLLLLIAIIGFATNLFSVARIRGLQSISLISVIGTIIFIGQLALLEASSGVYLSTGASLYLLPCFPYLLLTIVIELDVVSKQLTSRFGI